MTSWGLRGDSLKSSLGTGKILSGVLFARKELSLSKGSAVFKKKKKTLGSGEPLKALNRVNKFVLV